MNTHLKIFAAAAVTVGTMSIGYGQNTATGSENQLNNAADRAGDTTERAADKTGAALDNAAERSGNAAERAADRTGNAAENAADRTGNAAERAADKTGATLDNAARGQGVHGTAQAPDAEGIRDVLASTAEAAIKGSFSDVVERFVDADRNRIGEAMPSDEELRPLNDVTSQLRDAWEAKYNQEFDIEQEELVFNPSVKIRQGEFGATQLDSARTAGERSDVTNATPAQPDAETDTATPGHRTTTEGDTTVGRALDRTGDAVVGAADATGDAVVSAAERARQAAAGELDSNREKGRNMATVMIPASHGLPAINVPLIHELPDSWRIDVPNNVDAAKLRTNLQKQLTEVQQMKGQWPADANEAYLNVAHRVLLAIFEGTPHVQQGSGGGSGASAQPAAGTTPPTPAPATPAE